MSALLQARGLTRSHEGRQVLCLDELEVEAGEMLCLMGANGAGKSTLIRILNLIEKPDQGEVFFQGKRVDPGSGEARRRMAAVFQRPYLFRGSVAANVAYGLKLRRLPRGRIARRLDAVLAEMGLAHLRHRDASLLSGGEAQRVALARALVLEPELLFLDEPAAGLDREAAEALNRDLRRIAAVRAGTILYVTHSPAEARATGDRLAILEAGGLLQAGPMEQVFGHPADDRVVRLLRLDGGPDGLCPHCGRAAGAAAQGVSLVK